MLASKRHTPEQIINKWRQAEVEIAKGATIAQVCRKISLVMIEDRGVWANARASGEDEHQRCCERV